LNYNNLPTELSKAKPQKMQKYLKNEVTQLLTYERDSQNVRLF